MSNNGDFAPRPFELMETAWRRYRGVPTEGGAITRSSNGNGFAVSQRNRVDDSGDENKTKKSIAEANAEETRRINLSAMCIANIFQMEDKHLPDPLVKIYEHCLIQQRENPNDEQVRVTIRLCNYLFKNWHDTRNDLNFMRDIMKIVTTFARKFNSHAIILDQAIDGCPISKYRVWTTLLSRLSRETRGRSLGEYLTQKRLAQRNLLACGGNISTTSLFDMTGDGGISGIGNIGDNLFDPRDIDDSATDTNGIGFLAQFAKWPTVSYAKEVTKHLLRTLCKLSSSKFSSFEKYGNEFFRDSVPSWASNNNSDMNTDARSPKDSGNDLQASRESQNTRARVLQFLLSDDVGARTATTKANAIISPSSSITPPKSMATTTTTTKMTNKRIISNDRENIEEKIERNARHDDEEEEDLVSIDTLSLVNEIKWNSDNAESLYANRGEHVVHERDNVSSLQTKCEIIDVNDASATCDGINDTTKKNNIANDKGRSEIRDGIYNGLIGDDAKESKKREDKISDLRVNYVNVTRENVDTNLDVVHKSHENTKEKYSNDDRISDAERQFLANENSIAELLRRNDETCDDGMSVETSRVNVENSDEQMALRKNTTESKGYVGENDKEVDYDNLFASEILQSGNEEQRTNKRESKIDDVYVREVRKSGINENRDDEYENSESGHRKSNVENNEKNGDDYYYDNEDNEDDYDDEDEDDNNDNDDDDDDNESYESRLRRLNVKQKLRTIKEENLRSTRESAHILRGDERGGSDAQSRNHDKSNTKFQAEEEDDWI